MEFQVVSNKRLPKIRTGRNLIVFCFRKEMEAVTAGIEDRKTDTGTMKISSSALTVLDLLRYPQASGGIDNVATVLPNLGGSIDPEQLATFSPLVERPVVQRLGHLLERLGHDALTAPVRYSEDIDLVRTSTGPIGPILDRLHVVLEPWLGRAQFDRSLVAPKLRFRVEAEDGSGVPIRLKIEINIGETEAFDGPAALPLEVANPWFSGEADIPMLRDKETWGADFLVVRDGAPWFLAEVKHRDGSTGGRRTRSSPPRRLNRCCGQG